jgi:hypothetical protein
LEAVGGALEEKGSLLRRKARSPLLDSHEFTAELHTCVTKLVFPLYHSDALTLAADSHPRRRLLSAGLTLPLSRRCR